MIVDMYQRVAEWRSGWDFFAKYVCIKKIKIDMKSHRVKVSAVKIVRQTKKNMRVFMYIPRFPGR